MSERGTFVTGRIHCDKCMDVMIHAALEFKDFLSVTACGGFLAGRVSGSYPGEEVHVFERLVVPFLTANGACHPMRIAVLAEDGSSQVFRVEPQ